MKTLVMVFCLLMMLPEKGQAIELSGGSVFAKTRCFSLKAGKRRKFQYVVDDRGGYRAGMTVYVTRCNMGLLRAKKIHNYEIAISTPIMLEGGFSYKPTLNSRYQFFVLATGSWSIESIN